MARTAVDAVCLLARGAGLRCLEAMLEKPERYRICALFTHRYVPLSESSKRVERPEYPTFSVLASRWAIPFFTLDSRKDSLNLHGLLGNTRFNVLVSCNWRYKVPWEVLNSAVLGGVNLHRGKLPEYRGAEPVRRALEDGQKKITITGHRMTDEMDVGEMLTEKTIPVARKAGETVPQAVERIKQEIIPHYPAVLFACLEQMTKGRSYASL